MGAKVSSPTPYDESMKGRKPIHIHVFWSGCWGMDSLYWNLRRYLQKEFGRRYIRVTGERDRTFSYNFEVAVVPSGVLLHSRRLGKKTKGTKTTTTATTTTTYTEEFCDTVQERLALKDKIKTLLLAGGDVSSLENIVMMTQERRRQPTT